MKKSESNSQNRLVKECIFTSLMLLMEKKEFHEISITDITNKAGVSRMAYYRNYKSKENIITDYLDELFLEYLSEINNYERGSIYEFAYCYFVYFRRHEVLIRNLIRANLSTLILECFDKYLHLIFEDILNVNTSKETNKYEIDYIAGGLYKVLIQWVNNNLEESDEEMAQMIYNFGKNE